jgi:hypothetical protein
MRMARRFLLLSSVLSDLDLRPTVLLGPWLRTLYTPTPSQRVPLNMPFSRQSSTTELESYTGLCVASHVPLVRFPEPESRAGVPEGLACCVPDSNMCDAEMGRPGG